MLAVDRGAHCFRALEVRLENMPPRGALTTTIRSNVVARPTQRPDFIAGVLAHMWIQFHVATDVSMALKRKLPNPFGIITRHRRRVI